MSLEKEEMQTPRSTEGRRRENAGVQQRIHEPSNTEHRQETTRSWEGQEECSPDGLRSACGPDDTSTSDVQPPELGGDTHLLLKPPGLRDFVTASCPGKLARVLFCHLETDSVDRDSVAQGMEQDKVKAGRRVTNSGCPQP